MLKYIINYSRNETDLFMLGFFHIKNTSKYIFLPYEKVIPLGNPDRCMHITNFDCLDGVSIENGLMLLKWWDFSPIIFEWHVNAAGRDAIRKGHLLSGRGKKKEEKRRKKEVSHAQESPQNQPMRNYRTSWYQPCGFISFRMTHYWLLVWLYGRDRCHCLWLPLQVLIW